MDRNKWNEETYEDILRWEYLYMPSGKDKLFTLSLSRRGHESSSAALHEKFS